MQPETSAISMEAFIDWFLSQDQILLETRRQIAEHILHHGFTPEVEQQLDQVLVDLQRDQIALYQDLTQRFEQLRDQYNVENNPETSLEKRIERSAVQQMRLLGENFHEDVKGYVKKVDQRQESREGEAEKDEVTRVKAGLLSQ